MEICHGHRVRKLHPLFAAEVGGLDLSQPVDAGTVRAIWDAIDRYADWSSMTNG